MENWYILRAEAGFVTRGKARRRPWRTQRLDHAVGVIPSREERDFPCLRCIDPYGKTVFNHLQMETFLAEWEQVRERAHDESQKEAWEKIKQMAQTCQADRDLYLRFVGN